MPVIHAKQLPSSAQAFSLSDVEEAAKRVLLKAKLQAQNLIAAAVEEAEQLKEQARQEGSKEGFDHGHVEGTRHGIEAGRQQVLQQYSSELSTLVKTLTAVTEELDAHRHALESDGLREVVALAIAIAARVTKRQGVIDPAVLEANLSEAMTLAIGSADIRIAVHPGQVESLKASLPRLKLQWPDRKHVEIVEESGLSPGGCRVYTRSGSIDADLGTQLDRIVAELLPDSPTTTEGAA